MRLQITFITSEEFDHLQAEWNDLLARSACEDVFLRWEWIHTWWGIFQQNKRLFILTARRDGRLLGIAPFYVDRGGPIGLRVLKLCSEELSPDYLDIIAEKEQEAEIVKEFVNTLKQYSNQWDLISFNNLRAESRLLRDSSLFADYIHTARVLHNCPYVQIKGTFEDYFKTRSKLVSFSLEKKLAVLCNEKGVTHKVVNDEAGFSKGLGDLFLMHERRAKDKHIQSNFLPPDVKRFHYELGYYFLKERILNLQLLYQGEVPLCALYSFNYKKKTYVYQMGFDPEWRRWSVGAVLLYVAVRKAFTDGLEEFDFLKGTETYKSFWSNALRDEMQLTVYNKNLRGSFWHAMTRLKSILRRIKHTFAQ